MYFSIIYFEIIIFNLLYTVNYSCIVECIVLYLYYNELRIKWQEDKFYLKFLELLWKVQRHISTCLVL